MTEKTYPYRAAIITIKLILTVVSALTVLFFFRPATEGGEREEICYVYEYAPTDIGFYIFFVLIILGVAFLYIPFRYNILFSFCSFVASFIYNILIAVIIRAGLSYEVYLCYGYFIFIALSVISVLFSIVIVGLKTALLKKTEIPRIAEDDGLLEKINCLDDLKDNNLISEEEYAERRKKAIDDYFKI